MPTCATPYCKNAPRKQRRYCHKCRSRKQRAKNPMRACFETLRYNTRRRGKPFELTWEQFQQFCRKTVYMAGKGRGKDCWTIDCQENEKGYTIDNIRVLPGGANAAKGKKKLVYDWEHPEYAYVVNY